MRYEWALALGIVLISGCSSGPKLPAYEPPTLPKEQVALLHGHGGTYVITVDQQSVKGTGLALHNWGGNKVPLTGGTHRIVARQSVSSGRSTGEETYAFTHEFKAGHEYKIGPKSLFNRGLTLHDITSGEIIGAE